MSLYDTVSLRYAHRRMFSIKEKKFWFYSRKNIHAIPAKLTKRNMQRQTCIVLEGEFL